MSDDNDDTKTCIGVVFQFNAGGVVFEFPDGSGGDAIGFVKISGVKINSDSFIPPSEADSADKLSKYLQIGDEVRCTVKKDPELPMFEYTEDEEEVDATGDIKVTSKTAQIQPGWIAELAELVVSVNNSEDAGQGGGNSSNKPSELNSTEHEDDNMFNMDISDLLDYDGNFEETKAKSSADADRNGEEDQQEKTEAGNTENGTSSDVTKNEEQAMELDDLILLEDVDVDADILDSAGLEEGKKKAAKESSEARDSNSKKGTTTTPSTSRKESAVEENKENFIHKARLVQLQKPPIEGGKTFSAVLEIKEGLFAGQQVLTSTWKTLVFGRSLANATLTYFLKYGDECEIEYKVTDSKPVGQPLAPAVPTPFVIKTWFGSRTCPAEGDPGFEQWLKSHDIDAAQFVKWIRNLLPPKPYFPLPDDVHICRVVASIQESKGSAHSGFFLKVLTQLASVETIQASAEDPEIPQDLTEDAEGPKKVAILLRDDLYVSGVAVKMSDLKSLFKIGDDIKCQIRPITTSDRSQLSKELAQCPADCSVTHVAYLGYVGPKRPQCATLSPDEPVDRDKKTKDLSIEHFKAKVIEDVSTQKKSGSGLPIKPQDPLQAKAALPPGQFPGVTGSFYPQVSQGKIALATTVAAKAINFPKRPTESQAFTILENPKEIEVAIELVKNMLKSLMLHAKNNIQSKVVTSTAEIEGHLEQAKKVEQLLLKGGDDKRKSRSSSEAKEKDRTDKSKPGVRDAREKISSHKSSKDKEDLKEESNPLNLLREYVSKNKYITCDKDTIWFGSVGFPSKVLTNFKSSGIDGFYNLETLVHCVKNKPNPGKFFEYAIVAQKMGISPVAKQDIGPLISFLSGGLKEPKPANVVDISHRDLNPQLFNPNEKGSAWKTTFVPEKKTSDSRVHGAADQPEKKRFRYDETVHQPQPGQTASRILDDNRSRLSGSRSPTLERMQATRPLSPERLRSPSFRSDRVNPFSQPPDPFKPSAASPPRTSGRTDPIPTPETEEELQKKLWEEFKREREARRRREEEEEEARRRAHEADEARRRAHEAEEARRQAHEAEKARRRALEAEEARRRAYEADKIRQKREEDLEHMRPVDIDRMRRDDPKWMRPDDLDRMGRMDREEGEARHRAYEAGKSRQKREEDLERMRRDDPVRRADREEEEPEYGRRLAPGRHDNWERMMGELEKFENEVIRKSGPPPPPKIDLGERRAAPPPPPTLSHRPQPSSYRSRDEYEASYSKARPDVDDYLLMRRSELDDRTERRSWSREPDWDGDDGRGYRAADASATPQHRDDDDRRRDPFAASRVSSTEEWPTIGTGFSQPSYPGRF